MTVYIEYIKKLQTANISQAIDEICAYLFTLQNLEDETKCEIIEGLREWAINQNVSDLEIIKMLDRGGQLEEYRNIYIQLIAELRLRNNLYNSATEYLRVTDNKVFEKELILLEDLKASLTYIERRRLKNIFQIIDEEEEAVLDKEITSSIRQMERERLKKHFLELDKTEIVSEKPGILRTISKNWKRLAIAASIVGFISLAGYLFFQLEGKLENNQIAMNRESEISLFGKENNVTLHSRIYEVKEQKYLGFTTPVKVDSIKVIVRDVIAMSEILNFKKSFSYNDSSLISENKSINESRNIITERNPQILDSLNSLQQYLLSINNTYTYDPEKKLITLNIPYTDSLISVYKYPSSGNKSGLYIQFKKAFYKIDRGIAPRPLKQIDDSNLIKILERF